MGWLEMPKSAMLIVRVCGWLFLVLAVLSLFGRDRVDNLVGKASLYLAPFLAHFGMLARLQPRQGPPTSTGKTVGWSAIGIVSGLIGGYILWNALQFAAVSIHGGRFDAAASWGVLLLAAGLGFLVASAPYLGRPRPM